MKTKLAAFCMLILSAHSLIHAASPQEVARARRIAKAELDPLRVYQGKLYDLTEVCYGLPGPPGRRYLVSWPENYWVNGEVESIAKDFIVLRVSRSDNAETICLKGHPKQSKLVDGAVLKCPAFAAGRVQYKTVLGATKTVPLYEYGVPLAKSGQKFETVIKVSADGKTLVEVPFQP